MSLGYDSVQALHESGSDVWLVQITTVEDGQHIRMTSGTSPSVFDGRTFLPETLHISHMTSEDADQDYKVEITVPAEGNPAGALFWPRQTEQQVRVQIWHASYEDPESDELAGRIVAFVGRVTAAKRRDDEIVLECAPRSAESDRYGLNLLFSNECGLQLFGRRCQASRSFATAGCHVTVTGDTFQVAVSMEPGTLFAPGPARELRPLTVADFNAAELVAGGARFRISPSAMWTGDGAYILANVQTGFDDLTLRRLIEEHRDHLGNMVGTLTLNCGRTLDFCHLIHQNAHRFWGFPFVPTENPVGRSFENFKGRR